MRGETLTPNPNECNSTLTSGTSGGKPPPIHIAGGGGQLPNPNECNSMLMSVTRGEILIICEILGNPNECDSTLTSGTGGIYPYLCMDEESGHCAKFESIQCSAIIHNFISPIVYFLKTS